MALSPYVERFVIMSQGTILRIERISPNDGMGLRTVIFFKGCPLRCAWCSTPESQNMQPEWFYKQAKCRHCTSCIQECPTGALLPSADHKSLVRNKNICINCFRCAEICSSQAIGVYGKTMCVEQIMDEIRKDRLFYFHSGGGVTLSGGDILLQADFALELLQACREECLNTAAELDMFGDYQAIKKLIPYLNSYFVDIKIMDSQQHEQWTGVSNETILRNICQASQDFPHTPMYVRVPLIPSVNDSEKNILSTAQFCRDLPSCQSLEFLPFHRLGAASYQYTDRTYAFAKQEAMTTGAALERVGFLKEYQFPFSVKIAGRLL